MASLFALIVETTTPTSALFSETIFDDRHLRFLVFMMKFFKCNLIPPTLLKMNTIPNVGGFFLRKTEKLIQESDLVEIGRKRRGKVY